MPRKAKQGVKRNGRIRIVNTIPFPDKGQPRGHTSKYPFARMKVGDSFAYPGPVSTATSVAQYWTKKLRGHKFRARKIETGVRCWRVG